YGPALLGLVRADVARARRPSRGRAPRIHERARVTQRRIRAVYMRGGTRRCLVFHDADLPGAGPPRHRNLLTAPRRPDPYGIALGFLDPGGAGTGRLLPTGKPRDVVDGVEASLVDATNPVVFVRAKDVGLAGTETPQSIDADRSVSARLEAIRVEAARRIGLP